MNKQLTELMYAQSKTVTVDCNGQTLTFVIKAPSVHDKDMAMQAAKQVQLQAAQTVAAELDGLKALFSLYSVEQLIGLLVQQEQAALVEQAAQTLVDEDAPDYQERLAARVQLLQAAQASALIDEDQATLVEQLLHSWTTEQLEQVWLQTAADTLLARVLCDDNRKRLFDTAEQMKIALTDDVLQAIKDAYLTLMAERNNAQNFHKPHTSGV